MDRRGFLRLMGGAAAGATALPAFACGGGGDEPRPSAATKSRGERPVLRIAYWTHFVPAYDAWFDNEYTTRWGDEHDTTVVIDHIPLTELRDRAEAERTAGSGHDLFFHFQCPAAIEDDVIDHREIVEEVSSRLGPVAPLLERSARNPKTGRWFAFPQSWFPGPANFRTDLWTTTGRVPDTWDDVLAAGPALKRDGHPLGLSMSEDPDGHLGLLSLMYSYGAFLQDEDGNPSLGAPATVEAVKVMSAIYRAGMTDEVFGFIGGSSNNRYLASGTGSLILNAISALRAVEDQNAELAAKIALLPSPAGPAGRFGVYAETGFTIWRFAKNRPAAEQFLVDLALAGRDQFIQSRFFDLPAFPAAVPDLAELLAADPTGKYGLLADAASWTPPMGHPGASNAAIDEITNSYLIPRMFAAAARGEKTPEQAVADAAAEAQPVFDRWRERGKI
jgi:multiple sugar transport system substrate-binding protein